MVAANFEAKTDYNFDGVLLGVGFRVAKRLSVGGGYVVRLGKELSPGFRRDSRRLVADLIDDPAHQAHVERFRCLLNECCKGRDRDKCYDGFPLLDPRDSTTRVFAGEPVIQSINKSLFFGATCRTLGDCGSMRFPAYLQSLLPLGCRLRVWGYRTDIKRAAETRDLDVFSTSVEGYG